VNDPADPVWLMVRAGSIVGAAAGAVSLACAVVLWRRGERLCPRWTVLPFVWSGPFIFGFFVLHLFGFPLLIQVVDQAGSFARLPPPQEGVTPEAAHQISNQRKVMWGMLAFVPALLLLAVAVRTHLFAFPVRWADEWKSIPRTVILAFLVFATFGTAAYLLNGLLEWVFRQIGQPISEHPLSKMGLTGDGAGGWVFVLSTCVMAPALEEFLFRGLLVPWVGGKWYRPWVLLAFAVGIGWHDRDANINIPAIAFGVVLAAALFSLLWVGKRWRPSFPRRTVMAVWSSSALFALFHATIWPSPIPLFVLALGLGYLTARTRSWVPAAVAHGLFNAASTVFVGLRG
jgi:membrane protease YdiL (CAAX protease family)